MLRKAGVSFGAPHEPEFEDVVVSSALDSLVTGVIRYVVMFVLLEEVVRPQRVAGLQKTLDACEKISTCKQDTDNE